ncbi:hypothetical protein BOKEGFJH_00751 [Chlamydia avium]|uniref:Lipoprotein n=2 Tax=Chlamydia avium TaxID=1457141 RepID=W8JS15_9CHLA|nr:hypothetical protein [Chlamydia avium]AHK63628.1 Putative lipoprotein [Chlamydia avium 10DC88]EPP36207.1 putative lipoprotein [Chlamydia psittaci 10_743_SC13]EPP38885.1 putative lipoprotein [Chlamydia avium]VVT43215.1 hypothetical protein BOKEGFJH_00751 [Chlamydia avium]
MKKWLVICYAIAISCLGCLPVIGIVYHNVCTTKQWEDLNMHILALKIMQERTNDIRKTNTQLKQQHKNIQPHELLQASKRIELLNKEQTRLKSLNKNSLIAQSKEVWAREQMFLSSKNHVTWSVTQIADDLVSLRLDHPIEADCCDLEKIFYLLDPTNPNAPVAFFTHWEMVKSTTPLNNQVWSVNAEAISRWL